MVKQWTEFKNSRINRYEYKCSILFILSLMNKLIRLQMLLAKMAGWSITKNWSRRSAC